MQLLRETEADMNHASVDMRDDMSSSRRLILNFQFGCKTLDDPDFICENFAFMNVGLKYLIYHVQNSMYSNCLSTQY